MTFTYNSVVTQSQVDQRRKIKLKSLVDILQDVEAMHIDSLKTFSNYLHNNNIGIFLMYREIEIFEPLFQKDKIKVQSFPYFTNPIMGYRNTLIKDLDDNVLIGTTSLGSFINLKTLKIDKLPINIIESLDHQDKYEKLSFNKRKIDISHLEFKHVETSKILHTYIDLYNHVNNSVYVQLIEHHISVDYDYRLIKLEYKKALNLQEQYHIYVSTNHSNDFTIIIRNQLNEDNFIMMLS